MSRARAVPGRRVCAWCDPHHDIGPAIGIPAGQTTHTMCEAARAREEAAIGALIDEVSACAHGTPAGNFCTECEAQNEERPR